MLSAYVAASSCWSTARRPTTAPSTPGWSATASRMQVGFLVDQLTALMMVVVTFVSLCVHVYTIGYMARRSRLPALLQLHLAVHVLDADAGDGEQLPAAVLRLGSGGRGLLPADRLLVQAADARSSRTSRRSSSTASATSASCSASPASCTTPASLDYATVFAQAPQIAAADLRSCRRHATWSAR